MSMNAARALAGNLIGGQGSSVRNALGLVFRGDED